MHVTPPRSWKRVGNAPILQAQQWQRFGTLATTHETAIAATAARTVPRMSESSAQASLRCTSIQGILLGVSKRKGRVSAVAFGKMFLRRVSHEIASRRSACASWACASRNCTVSASGIVDPAAFPAKPTWSIRAYLDASREVAAAHPPVPVETVVHVAGLSRLEVAPGTPAFDRLSRDLNSMAALMQNVARVSAALPPLEPPAVDDGIAEERRADLRRDVAAPPASSAMAADSPPMDSAAAVEGPTPPQPLLRHAAVRQGDYVAVPKFVDG
jgi:hypothetical protein